MDTTLRTPEKTQEDGEGSTGTYPTFSEGEEEQGGTRELQVQLSVPENVMRRIHSTEVHGRIPAQKNEMENLSQKMDEILKILPDLQKDLTDLKTEVADLKKNQWDNPETSKSRQERIRDVLGPVPLLHQKGKAMEIPRPNTRDERIREVINSISLDNSRKHLELDRENFIRLVELSLEGSVKIGWDNTPEDTKANILAGDSKSTIAERLGRLIKIHFIGDGYFEGSKTEKAREYAQALFGLELRSICAVDEYIYWFRKYFFQSGVVTEIAAPMLFAKICGPWRKMLIQSYKVPEGQLDSVAMRMSFLKDKLKDWCYQASIQNEETERRRSWWSKSKARTYKSGQRTGPTRASSQGSRRTDTRSTGRTPTRRTFRWAHTRANENFKDCNCWTCGVKGHISLDCPQKRGELCKFEATNDILDAVYYGDLVPVYQFEDIPSDESVYEEEIETDSDGSSTESENYNEGDRLQTSKSLSGFFSRMTVSNKTMERIMRQDSNLSPYDGFRIGGIGRVLNQIGLNQRKHHIIYKVSSGEFAIPMELTGNVMEMQLIPKEEILEELSKLREEVAVAMKWIRIGAIEVVIKATFKEGIDSEIHLSIMDRRINNLRDGCLGTMIENLYAGKLMFDIHPRIAYNLADQDFSRVLTLHQDFKRKDLMKEGNRPYSITYRIAYALSNTHHSDLFLRKEYIEIPRIFKEFAKVMTPNPIKIPRIGGVDLVIKDHPVLERTLSTRTEFSSRMSFLEDRIVGYRGKKRS
ncbi:UNVERIFIED_CONTAM: movement protein [Sesamum latifolium]|uniref:Movement protein n=1 Tax=Sesamum latifolium TaxID=2727402 RepID=A0AAW2UVY8_9LAMI